MCTSCSSATCPRSAHLRATWSRSSFCASSKLAGPLPCIKDVAEFTGNEEETATATINNVCSPIAVVNARLMLCVACCLTYVRVCVCVCGMLFNICACVRVCVHLYVSPCKQSHLDNARVARTMSRGVYSQRAALCRKGGAIAIWTGNVHWGICGAVAWAVLCIRAWVARHLGCESMQASL